MDKTNSITITTERKRGQHLGSEERADPDTPLNAAPLCTRSTEAAAAVQRAFPENQPFCAGWQNRYELISGLWMPALVMRAGIGSSHRKQFRVQRRCIISFGGVSWDLRCLTFRKLLAAGQKENPVFPSV